MRHSRFWELMAEEFGEGYARSLANNQHLTALGGRTAQQALDAGEAPRAVWAALTAQMDVPVERRHGREVPPPRS
ncbi:DUF3046 domain-containing protein [Phycicoccus sp. MAQZ13P-2]|uniref:DUF3046 domain-containing protein n=1 Tax=Phycicoccus TaxID=367298 RepID=UPI0004C31EAA|nr:MULTISPECIES: DUF3046 domain-containing protein [Phycicoccus]MBT9255667.1 DUF3046 domain-containing protein [Phycicoccus mangrovi]MBT9274260.1 DUF3046 domain-containing protein [Phycicoccus mangrovi]GIL35823.1 hypothetical protein PDTK01_18980 [Phycicoccus sp. DTK01]